MFALSLVTSSTPAGKMPRRTCALKLEIILARARRFRRRELSDVGPSSPALRFAGACPAATVGSPSFSGWRETPDGQFDGSLGPRSVI